jgi:hypothetical protein
VDILTRFDDPRKRLDPHNLALVARRNPFQSKVAHQPKTLRCLTWALLYFSRSSVLGARRRAFGTVCR